MFIEVLDENRRSLLALLGKSDIVKTFYLAGGTALALQLGHRSSEDFDFFSPEAFNPHLLISELSDINDVEIIGEQRGTLHALLYNVKLSFFQYPYPLLFPAFQVLGCRVADYRDIVPMKLIAIAQRATKKDFVDLYYVLQEKMTIFEALEVLKAKYKGIKYNLIHIIKSLAYFEEARNSPPPFMLRPQKRVLSKDEWEKIEQFFLSIQREVLKKIEESALK